MAYVAVGMEIQDATQRESVTVKRRPSFFQCDAAHQRACESGSAGRMKVTSLRRQSRRVTPVIMSKM